MLNEPEGGGSGGGGGTGGTGGSRGGGSGGGTGGRAPTGLAEAGPDNFIQVTQEEKQAIERVIAF